MLDKLPEPIQEILGNPRYKFAILIILALLAVFFIYGDSVSEYVPELLAAGSLAASTTVEPSVDVSSVIPDVVNVEMLAPF